MPTIERETRHRQKGEIVMRARHWRETLAHHQMERARHDTLAKIALTHIQDALRRAYALDMKTHEIWKEE